ncbi:MAG TPA: hypothetical protein VM096_01085 [Vicinamibacterales bacterium]|nr:hypothetical protein [Vicinamibacterales bacterium]
MEPFLQLLDPEGSMGRFVSALASALLVSGATLFAQAQAPVTQTTGTERISPQAQAAAKNLMQDVSTVGCIRLWRPTTGDPTRMPPERQPGLAGVYLLTPLAAGANATTDLPTYLLTPSGTLNFSQHVGRQVEITGSAQTAPLPPTVQEIASAPTQRPEEKPSTNGMPRLTVTTMRVVSESCP